MSRRTEYRNELKTRVPDEIVEALRAWKALHGVQHDSSAVERILRLHLFGSIGSLPADLIDRSAYAVHSGTRVAA
jgi:hypothetical protein